MTGVNPLILAFSNPYHDTTFFSFLTTFFWRMGLFVTGQLHLQQLAQDEVQVLVLMGVAISCAIVGSFLVLRRMTMLANSLSHTILIGIVLAFVLTPYLPFFGGNREEAVPISALLIAAIACGIFTGFLTEFLTKTMRLKEDASCGLVFTTLFAVGLILLTVLTRSAHIGTEAVMGDADALQSSDLSYVYLVALANALIIALFYKEYLVTTFDGALALALGISPLFFNYLLMAQVSATTIISFRAVGVLLVLAFMVGPAIAARCLTHRLSTLLVLAAVIGSLCALLGVALSRHMVTVYGIALSTAGVVSTVILGVTFSILAKRLHDQTKLKAG